MGGRKPLSMVEWTAAVLAPEEIAVLCYIPDALAEQGFDARWTGFEFLSDRRREGALYKRQTLLVTLAQSIRICSVEADREISDLDESRCVPCNSGRVADAADVVHVRLTAPACQHVNRLANNCLYSTSREVVNRPERVLRYMVEDGDVHRGRCRSGTEGLCDVDAMSD